MGCSWPSKARASWSARVDAELEIDVAQVVFDRLRAEEHRGRRFPVVLPAASSRAICSSCGVSSSIVLGSRRRTVSPVAASSARARSLHRPASSALERLQGSAQLLACQHAAARAAQPLAVGEAGPGRLELVGRLRVELDRLLGTDGRTARSLGDEAEAAHRARHRPRLPFLRAAPSKRTASCSCLLAATEPKVAFDQLGGG